MNLKLTNSSDLRKPQHFGWQEREKIEELFLVDHPAKTGLNSPQIYGGHLNLQAWKLPHCSQRGNCPQKTSKPYHAQTWLLAVVTRKSVIGKMGQCLQPLFPFSALKRHPTPCNGDQIECHRQNGTVSSTTVSSHSMHLNATRLLAMVTRKTVIGKMGQCLQPPFPTIQCT